MILLGCARAKCRVLRKTDALLLCLLVLFCLKASRQACFRRESRVSRAFSLRDTQLPTGMKGVDCGLCTLEMRFAVFSMNGTVSAAAKA